MPAGALLSPPNLCAPLVKNGVRFLHGLWLLEHLHDDVGEAVPAELRVSRLRLYFVYVWKFTVEVVRLPLRLLNVRIDARRR